jgi:hypothetical protein
MSLAHDKYMAFQQQRNAAALQVDPRKTALLERALPALVGAPRCGSGSCADSLTPSTSPKDI